MVLSAALLSVTSGCPSASSSLSVTYSTNYGYTYPDSVYFITTNSTQMDFQAEFYCCINNYSSNPFDAAHSLVQLIPAADGTGAFYLIFVQATNVTPQGASIDEAYTNPWSFNWITTHQPAWYNNTTDTNDYFTIPFDITGEWVISPAGNNLYTIANLYDGQVLTGWPNQGNNLDFTNLDYDDYQMWSISNAGSDINGNPVTNVTSIVTGMTNVITNTGIKRW